ncbi:unnamed protein product, partial [marine sediment metagenome]
PRDDKPIRYQDIEMRVVTVPPAILRAVINLC